MRPNLRIVVPTATLVRHFQHELARDGVVFSPHSVVSLSRFVKERAASSCELVPDGLLHAIVRRYPAAESLPGIRRSRDDRRHGRNRSRHHQPLRECGLDAGPVGSNSQIRRGCESVHQVVARGDRPGSRMRLSHARGSDSGRGDEYANREDLAGRLSHFQSARAGVRGLAGAQSATSRSP